MDTTDTGASSDWLSFLNNTVSAGAKLGAAAMGGSAPAATPAPAAPAATATANRSTWVTLGLVGVGLLLLVLFAAKH